MLVVEPIEDLGDVKTVNRLMNVSSQKRFGYSRSLFVSCLSGSWITLKTFFCFFLFIGLFVYCFIGIFIPLTVIAIDDVISKRDTLPLSELIILTAVFTFFLISLCFALCCSSVGICGLISHNSEGLLHTTTDKVFGYDYDNFSIFFDIFKCVVHFFRTTCTLCYPMVINFICTLVMPLCYCGFVIFITILVILGFASLVIKNLGQLSRVMFIFVGFFGTGMIITCFAYYFSLFLCPFVIGCDWMDQASFLFLLIDRRLGSLYRKYGDVIFTKLGYPHSKTTTRTNTEDEPQFFKKLGKDIIESILLFNLLMKKNNRFFFYSIGITIINFLIIGPIKLIWHFCWMGSLCGFILICGCCWIIAFIVLLSTRTFFYLPIFVLVLTCIVLCGSCFALYFFGQSLIGYIFHFLRMAVQITETEAINKIEVINNSKTEYKLGIKSITEFICSFFSTCCFGIKCCNGLILIVTFFCCFAVFSLFYNFIGMIIVEASKIDNRQFLYSCFLLLVVIVFGCVISLAHYCCLAACCDVSDYFNCIFVSLAKWSDVISEIISNKKLVFFKKDEYEKRTDLLRDDGGVNQNQQQQEEIYNPLDEGEMSAIDDVDAVLSIQEQQQQQEEEYNKQQQLNTRVDFDDDEKLNIENEMTYSGDDDDGSF